MFRWLRWVRLFEGCWRLMGLMEAVCWGVGVEEAGAGTRLGSKVSFGLGLFQSAQRGKATRYPQYMELIDIWPCKSCFGLVTSA
ncbi:uncharacterized protein K460DRAFT_367598 [Cucurbitaria berberidis CBS 394.84]|uniref:Secreted protein n=1 Tax=Cucurbitaria berberidis CBS 394.84 TaxID=1168544 RepID=A0A9P4LA40_9PLEO|nr:uncharacterized protein K460DRAFT_367598 [Cucurbitaria berberidis CBS 394.84]KAF1846844.1 hypothetical protein K460DRAFT_367598 [Cucurbitaria berberidis CBS 394.84]